MQLLQNVLGYSGTGFGISQCVVMVLEVVATGGSNGVELVIRQRMPELSAGCCKGVVEDDGKHQSSVGETIL